MDNEQFLKALEIKQQAKDYTPLVYSSDAIEAAAEVGEYSTAMDSVRTFQNKSKLNHGEKTPYAELNRMYPHMEEPFTEDLSPEYAKFLADRMASKQRYQNMQAHGNQNLSHQLAYFGAGMYSHVTDPIEFGVGVLGGWAVGAAAAGLAGTSALVGTRIGAAAAFMARSPILTGVAGDIVGNLAAEPLMMMGAREAGDTYTKADFILSTVAAPIGLSALKYGGTKALKGLRYAGGRALEKAFQTSTMQVAMGKKVDLANVHDAAIARMDNGNAFVYKAQDIGNMKEGVLYMAGDDFNSHGNVSGLDVEGSVHLTDNPNRASGISIGEGDSGRLTEVSIKDLNIMDGTKDLEPTLKLEVNEFLSKSEIEGAPKTASEVLDLIQENAKDVVEATKLSREFIEIIKKDGFEGLSLKQDILEGGTTKSEGANSLTIFDNATDKISKKKSITVEKSAKAKADESLANKREIERIESDKSNMFNDEESNNLFDSKEKAYFSGTPKVEPLKADEIIPGKTDFDVNHPTKEIQMETENSMTRLKDLEAEGRLTNEVADIRDEIVLSKEKIELEAEITKASIACMR